MHIMAKEDTPQIPQRLYKGLNTDLSPVDQPKGTYRFALNAVSETREGDTLFLSNEEGTEQYTSLVHNGLGYIIIGSIYIDDNEHIVFGVTHDEEQSFIALLTGQGELQVLIDDNDNSCLKLKITNQIQGEYKLRNGCEKTIYWVDGVNPVRTYNMLEDYLSDDPDKKYNCLKFNLVEGTGQIPTFDEMMVDVGGKLKSGTYNFAIQYVDENLNETAWLTTSQLISIYVGARAGNYDGIIGSSNKVIGDPGSVSEAIFGSPPSNKRILLTIGNLNTNYEYYRIAVIEATSGIGLPTRALLSELLLTSDKTFIHDGNESKYTEIPIENVLLPTPDIGTASHIEQVEDRLLLGNTKGTPRPYCDYQELASKITSKYVSEYVPAHDYDKLGDPKNPSSYFEKISYMGGEVYAFGIVYTFPDGTETPSYHIPGRPAMGNEREMIHPWIPDIEHITGKLLPKEITKYNAKPWVERWRVYDTAEVPGSVGENGEGLMAFWEMSDATYVNPHKDCTGDFYGYDGYDGHAKLSEETRIRHHKFPNRVTVPHFTNVGTADMKKSVIDVIIRWPGYDTSGIDIGDSITNYEYRYKIDGSSDWSLPVKVEILKTTDDTDIYTSTITVSNNITDFEILDTCDIWLRARKLTINGQNIDTGEGDEIFISSFYWEVILGNVVGSIGLLGIKFDNISIPDGATGYRIVRGKRDKFNRTVQAKAYSGLTRVNDEYVTFQGFTESSSSPFATDNDLKGGQIRNDNNIKYFVAPENMFFNEDIVPAYIKVENRFLKDNQAVGTTGAIQDVNNDKGGWFDNDGFDWKGTYRIEKFMLDGARPSESNHTAYDTRYLGMVDSRQNYIINDRNDTRKLYNCSWDNKIGFARLNHQYTDNDEDNLKNRITYVSMKNDIDVHPVLDNIKYYQCKNNIQDKDNDTNFGGDIFISHFYLTNTLYQGFKSPYRIWDFIVKSLVIAVSALVGAFLSVITAGAFTVIAIVIVAALIISVTVETIILAVETFSKDYQETSLDEVSEDAMTDRGKMSETKDDLFFHIMEHNYGLFIESDINVALRESSTSAIKGMLSVHAKTSASEYLIDKILVWDADADAETDRKYNFNFIVKPEVYHYNLDYSRENQEKVWFALSSTYNCCSKCLEKFPNRIFYSEKSFIEEVFDSYGKFLPLNYITVPGEHGEITNIFAIKNALYAHTKGNLWYIPQNIQERLTGDVVSLIGSGGFFDSPPRKVYDDDIGAAGSMQKFATLKTKYGVFFVDDIDGRIYALNFSSQAGTDIDDISNKGIQKWLQYNIPFNLYNDIYTLTKYKFENITNPANPSGVGFLSAYDTRNNRILFTKRDSTILDEKKEHFKIYDDPLIRDNADVGSWDPTIADEWGYNHDDSNFYYFYKVGTRRKARRITLLNKTYFHDKSWTLSYSFSTAAWTSFHSYMPNFYIYDRKNFYSSVLTAIDIPIPEMYSIYKHNIEGVYQTYHNNGIKPFIIDYVSVDNPLETGIIDEITLQTIATKADVEQRYVTFNKFVAYNSRQCSGELELVPADKDPDVDYMSRSVINEAGKINIRKFEKDWKINGYKDYRIDYDAPVFVDNWDSIKDKYFIDKVVNVTSIDFNKDWTQLERFRDKYLRIRLIFDAYNDIKLTTNYSLQAEKSVNI